MPRFFNTAGPCRPEIHYTLSATDRLPNIERLIEQESYFVIHAPRQTGKSTAMLTLAQQLLEQGKWVAVTVSALSSTTRPSSSTTIRSARSTAG